VSSQSTPAASSPSAAAVSRPPAAASVVRNVVSIGLARGVSILFDGAAYILIARNFSTSDYGHYVSIYALITLVDLAADMTVFDVGVREIASHPHQRETWLGAVTALRTLLALIGTAFFLAYIWFGHLGQDPSLLPAALIAALAIPTGALRTPLALFRAMMRMEYEFALIGGTRFLNLIGVLLVIFLRGSIIYLFLVMLGSRLALGIAAWALSRFRFGVRCAFETSTIAILARESFPMGVSGTLVAAQLKLDLVMVAMITGSTAAGIYGVVAQVPEYLLYLPVIVSTPLLPLLSRAHAQNDQPQFERLYARLIGTMLILVFPLVVLGSMRAADVVNLLFGEKYKPAAILLPWIMFSVAAMWISHALAISTVAAKLQRHFIWIQGTCATVYLVMNTTLIPGFGYWGALSARVVAMALAPVLTFVAVRRAFAAKLRWSALVTPLLAGSAMAASLLLLREFPFIAAAIVATAIYVVVALCTYRIFANAGGKA
jgi:O-antigen/teichoic acid export membrane protein